MLKLERLIIRLNSILHTKIRLYDNSGNIIQIYGDDNFSQDELLLNKDFETKLLSQRNINYPIFLNHGNSNLYAIIAIGNKSDDSCIVGPCTIKSKGFKGNICNLIEFETFCEGILLLHDMMGGKYISKNELIVKNTDNSIFENSLEKKFADISYEYHENELNHNPYTQELREQSAIEHGDRIALERSINETYSGKIGKLSDDPLRNQKNLGIVLVTLASRSAIKGGLHPEIAFSLSDSYIQKIEELDNINEVNTLSREAEFKYAQLVHDQLHKCGKNVIITEAKKLVSKYMHQKIKIKDIALELNCSPDYITQLFLKEENITFSEYIINEKIRLACERLIYSNDTLYNISYTFGFSSQSHFGKVFKEKIGITPAEYRRKFK